MTGIVYKMLELVAELEDKEVVATCNEFKPTDEDRTQEVLGNKFDWITGEGWDGRKWMVPRYAYTAYGAKVMGIINQECSDILPWLDVDDAILNEPMFIPYAKRLSKLTAWEIRELARRNGIVAEDVCRRFGWKDWAAEELINFIVRFYKRTKEAKG